MKVFFLSANQPLVKYFQQILGQLDRSPYPSVKLFTSHEVHINSLQDFYMALTAHAVQGHCLLKGQLNQKLTNESRARHTDSVIDTNWILFDLDGIANITPDLFMERIGLGDISYIVQYSASSGVYPQKGLSCHIFVLLDTPVNPTTLKAWLTELNLIHFEADITLNKLGESFHWPIDITTCQNDKLIYIAPPICDPSSLDTFNQPRIQIINKAQPKFQFPSNFSQAHIDAIEILRNDLREKRGLPKVKKEKYDKYAQSFYTPTSKKARLTGKKVGGEFTHLNLNGGDSWGYYHLTKRPLLIYNFKGEPTYKIEELLPDYWIELQKAQDAENIQNAPRAFLALRDFETDIYYNGWYDRKTDTLKLTQASSKDKLHDFLTTNGIPIPEAISDWNCSYDPLCCVRADVSQLKINWFVPSEYMRLTPSIVAAPPPTILKLIENVIGTDLKLVDHFLNWCACAYRYRLPCGTAWIIQGVPGTGKGMLINEVLRPLFGADNVSIKRMSELSDRFNEYIENTLLCFIDEINIGEDRHHDKTMADLKQQITEPIITIRKMRAAAREVRNYTNWIFSTNNKQPIRIEEGDRRYNVGDFCNEPLEMQVDTDEFVEKIHAELVDFNSYLITRTANKKQASRVLHTEARASMIEGAMVTADVVSKAIRNGNLMKLYEWIEDSQDIADNTRFAQARAYEDLIHSLIMTRRTNITRGELYTIFATTVGKVPREPAKFSQYLGHHEIKIKQVRVGKNVQGIQVDWVVDEQWLKEVQKEISLGKVAPLVPVKVPKETKDSGDGKA